MMMYNMYVFTKGGINMYISWQVPITQGLLTLGLNGVVCLNLSVRNIYYL